MIKTIGLNKVYGKKEVLKDVNLTFEKGKIYGILGRNGAGKTTLVNLITNRALKTSGEIEVDGKSAYENDFSQEKIFCITEKNAYPTSEKISNLFNWASRFYPSFDIDYANELAKKFDLEVDKKLGKLSTGYTTIAKVILTLASNAPYMIFDEPVLGIDAIYREVFYEELLLAHKRLNNCIILATHILDESEKVIDEVVVLRDGRVVHNSALSEINKKQSLQTFYLELHKSNIQPNQQKPQESNTQHLQKHGAIDINKVKNSVKYLLYITWLHALIITVLCVVFTCIPLLTPESEMWIELTLFINVLVLAINVQAFYFKYALYNGVSRRTYIVSVILVLMSYALWFAVLSGITVIIHNSNGYFKGLFQAFYTTKFSFGTVMTLFAWLFMSILFIMSVGLFSMVLFQTLTRKGKYIAMSIIMLIVIALTIWASLAPLNASPVQVFLFLIGLKSTSHGAWFSIMWFFLFGAVFSIASWLILRRIEVK